MCACVCVFLSSFTLSGIDLSFINDTPVVVEDEVYAEFAANKSGLNFHCRLSSSDKYNSPYNYEEDCERIAELNIGLLLNLSLQVLVAVSNE